MSKQPEPIPTPNDIVGHKTFSDGEGGYRHEPLTRAEADAILEACDAAKAQRANDMPDVATALKAFNAAHTRLKELGWQEAIYCPKDGSAFEVIEAGSSGIHIAHYEGEWPTGSWWVRDGGDLWPSRPVLWRKERPPEHEWFVHPLSVKWFGKETPTCRECGIIRREDGQNKPCRGRVTIGLRENAIDS